MDTIFQKDYKGGGGEGFWVLLNSLNLEYIISLTKNTISLVIILISTIESFTIIAK